MAKVYFGSVAVTKPSAPSTLPGKLQRILRKCNLPKLCSGDWVPVKMHLGSGLGYSTVHPASGPDGDGSGQGRRRKADCR